MNTREDYYSSDNKDKGNIKWGKEGYCPHADFYKNQETLWQQFQEVQNKKSAESVEPITISAELDYYYIAGLTDHFGNFFPSISEYKDYKNKEYKNRLFSLTFNVSAPECISLIQHYFKGYIINNFNKTYNKNYSYLKFKPEESVNFIEQIHPYLKLKQQTSQMFFKLLKYRFIDKEEIWNNLFAEWNLIKDSHGQNINLFSCCKCNLLKTEYDYNKSFSSVIKDKKELEKKSGYICCKLCLGEKMQENYLDNRVSRLEYQQEYRRDNKEKINESRRNSIPIRLKNNLVGRLRSLLTKNTTGKSKLVGCDYDFLKEYIEKQFQPGMSWENYGLWEIDHIIPLAYFNLEIESERNKAGHYTNLQPLWEEDNNKKQDYLKNGKLARNCRKLSQ